jgi:O-methyltransferase involved in polyketide biosynthesis
MSVVPNIRGSLKQPIALGAVQETMLIPLYGRALASRSGGTLLHDPRAVEIVETIEYDFRRFRRFSDGALLLGAVLRTRLLDMMVGSFLRSAPRGTVVEIGAGLNTRFERVDNGILRWVDVDLPDAMALRRRFFSESARRAMVACSVLERTWTAVATQCPGPYFIVAEGVFGYLQESEVKAALALIADDLPGATIAFDTTAPDDVRDRRSWPGLRARVAWMCDDPREIERWGLGYRLVSTRAIGDMPPLVESALPTWYRHTLGIARVLGWKTDTSRINLYRNVTNTNEQAHDDVS